MFGRRLFHRHVSALRCCLDRPRSREPSSSSTTRMGRLSPMSQGRFVTYVSGLYTRVKVGPVPISPRVELSMLIVGNFTRICDGLALTNARCRLTQMEAGSPGGLGHRPASRLHPGLLTTSRRRGCAAAVGFKIIPALRSAGTIRSGSATLRRAEMGMAIERIRASHPSRIGGMRAWIQEKSHLPPGMRSLQSRR